MNKKLHILITIFITVLTLIVAPLIYNQPFMEHNVFVPEEEKHCKEMIEKDNVILKRDENTIRVMTFNLLAHYPSWGGKPVHGRADVFFSLRDGYLPDVLGVQEMCGDWYSEFSANKSPFKFVSPLKTAFPPKMTALIYNSNTVEIIDSGSVAFSDTLNFQARRIVWGVFKFKATNDIFTVVNTHLSFLEATETEENFFKQARQVNELYSTTKELYCNYPYPIIIIGDFNAKKRDIYHNSVIRSGSYGILNSVYTDAQDLAENKFFGENAYLGNSLNDHIFIKGELYVKNIALLSQNTFSELSDHYPLIADISFENKS